MSDDVIIAPAIATTALVPEAHVRMGPTAHEPIARVKINAWGAVTDTVKAAASALPVAQLVKPAAAQPAKPAAPAKRIQIVEPTKPAKTAVRIKQAKLSGPVEPVTSGDSPMAAAIKRAFQKQAKAA
jgi:hypothetical protein